LDFGIEKTIIRAKAQRTPSDGPRAVIPSECEGAKKDFSLWSKSQGAFLCALGVLARENLIERRN
jgi:hypothetical protein